MIVCTLERAHASVALPLVAHIAEPKVDQIKKRKFAEIMVTKQQPIFCACWDWSSIDTIEEEDEEV